jgi:[protein-PII] uridylyltransferase
MSEIPGAAVIRCEESGESESSLALYLASMPRKYRNLFDGPAIRAHAEIVARRGERAAHAEIWKTLPSGGAAVCIASEDTAGLLARIAAAMVAHAFDVVAAQVYCREHATGGAEAVDFFWIRRVRAEDGDIEPSDVTSLAQTLEELVRGAAGLERLRHIAPVVAEKGTQMRVGFESDPRDGAMVLTVQGSDRPGLLFVISQALFLEGARITHSDVATHDGRVLDRFHLTEMDGAPLRRARLLGIQTAVLASLDGLA